MRVRGQGVCKRPDMLARRSDVAGNTIAFAMAEAGFFRNSGYDAACDGRRGFYPESG